MFGASACGGEAEPLDSQATTTVTTATTTTTTTEPPEPTTTIDFSIAPDQGIEPLADEATVADIVELVDDVRGPTAGLARQIERLTPFVDLTSPPGAQIMDVTVSAETADDDRNDLSVSAVMRAPQTGPELVKFFNDELRARGWITAGREDETIDGVEWHRQIFRVPGVPGDTTELTVSVGAGPVSWVEVDYASLSEEDDETVSLLAFWQESLALPRGSTVSSASVSTVDDEVVLTVVHQLDADSPDEAFEDLVDLVDEDDFTLSGGQANLTGPITLTGVEDEVDYTVGVVESRQPEVVEIVVTSKAALTPID